MSAPDFSNSHVEPDRVASEGGHWSVKGLFSGSMPELVEQKELGCLSYLSPEIRTSP